MRVDCQSVMVDGVFFLLPSVQPSSPTLQMTLHNKQTLLQIVEKESCCFLDPNGLVNFIPSIFFFFKTKISFEYGQLKKETMTRIIIPWIINCFREKKNAVNRNLYILNHKIL